jgi:hypothetical protein
MTLNTRIAVLQPVPVKELFDWVNTNLLKAENPMTYDEQEHAHDYAAWKAAGGGKADLRQFQIPIEGAHWTMGNQMGQGFAAIFEIEYRPDGPLYAEDEYYYDEDRFPDLAEAKGWDAYPASQIPEGQRGRLAHPAMAMQIVFDTGYSYQHETMGFGCGTLHAIYINLIGSWLAERGVGYRWYNEFNGTWNDAGTEQNLIGGGDEAKAWFERVVKPAIIARAVQDGAMAKFL